MTIHKNKAFWLIIAIGVVLFVIYLGSRSADDGIVSESPTPIVGVSPDVSPLPPADAGPTATPRPSPEATEGTATPTPDGRTTFIDEPVPWTLLLAGASCELKGEIKFLNHNTYDNQDALFVYNGVDHPGRNIFWTVTPEDDISVGPNLFSKLTLPNGESLLGIALPDDPKHDRYELTAKIQYGRLIDEEGNFVTAGGNVKVFEKQCDGKTTIVLP